MLALSEADIQIALERLADGVKRYQWLQANVLKCNVSADRDFQKHFDAFYRVRRGPSWRAAFFALMEYSKGRTGIDFAQALRSLNILDKAQHGAPDPVGGRALVAVVRIALGQQARAVG